ncbi:hypothetical protein MAR_032985 [Mya arenaria]|uniref:Uncharacterized protein n=1 Tax=Mya arenaria TaxID=6604 RepID=A0ABY7GB29_MYAAR|nr:hypothetical protein MAR_032985 [Mya arenaria]
MCFTLIANDGRWQVRSKKGTVVGIQPMDRENRGRNYADPENMQFEEKDCIVLSVFLKGWIPFGFEKFDDKVGNYSVDVREFQGIDMQGDKIDMLSQKKETTIFEQDIITCTMQGCLKRDDALTCAHGVLSENFEIQPICKLSYQENCDDIRVRGKTIVIKYGCASGLTFGVFSHPIDLPDCNKLDVLEIDGESREFSHPGDIFAES